MRTRTSALALALLLAGGTAAAADCTLGGTFLTIKSHDVAADVVKVGRTMLSFLPGGNIVMIDAAQGGIAGFQPFTDARGEWSCEAPSGGAEQFRAFMIDFTMPTTAEPNAQVVRVDLQGHHENGAIKGSATISFYPLSGDPLDKNAGSDVIGYDFTGTRIGLDAP